MRPRRLAPLVATLAAALLAAPRADAQGRGTDAAAAAVVTDAATDAAAGNDATPTALPPGHPPVDPAASSSGGDPHDPHAGGLRQARLAQDGAAEASDLPPGVIVVRVVDARGAPVPEALVRLGALREGERQAPREARADVSGAARFERLETGTNVAYRLSVEHEGARFSSTPVQLPTHAGYRVQIVRHDVEHEPRAVLISDARVEIGFQDDRIIVVQRISVVNFSTMSLTSDEPHPVAYVPPPAGLRFRLPAGYSAFRTDEQATMGDQHLTEEDGQVVFRGSIPPTVDPRDPLQLVWQFRIKITDTELPIDLSLPLPVLRALVVTQAPRGMQLKVDGMRDGVEDVHNNQRILVTGVERRTREDPAIDQLRIRLVGIPAPAGPERWLALALALALVAGSCALAVASRGGGGRPAVARSTLEAERDGILREAAALLRAHESGEVGPETYARRRRELTATLAAVLRRLADAPDATPRVGPTARPA